MNDEHLNTLKSAEEALAAIQNFEAASIVRAQKLGSAFDFSSALLHKSADDGTSPYPGQTYPTTFVTGMPSAVKPFSTATRTWNSAT